METRNPATLTAADVLALAKIIEAAQLRLRFARTAPGTSATMHGQVRGLVVSQTNHAFLRADDDVRDACLWATGLFEHFWPVRELVREITPGNLEFIRN